MNRFCLPIVTASALIFGFILPKELAAQTAAKDLEGTWTLVSITLEQDGKKTDFYGPNPQGQLIRKRQFGTLTILFGIRMVFA